jgi:SAM-dependent methyltransferase
VRAAHIETGNSRTGGRRDTPGKFGMTNEWTKPNHALEYLRRHEDIPHRKEGESTLIEEIPKHARRILDLGCGDGHLLALLLAHCGRASGVGLDFSPTMLEEAEQRFLGHSRARLVMHNLDLSLPDLGTFDVVASSFAIHHCTDNRKRTLYEEIWNALEPGGIFCNLEHVASPTEQVHRRFLKAMNIGVEQEDPSNKLVAVEIQLQWLREIGYEDVDCYWKWRELALLIGRKPECE